MANAQRIGTVSYPGTTGSTGRAEIPTRPDHTDGGLEMSHKMANAQRSETVSYSGLAGCSDRAETHRNVSHKENTMFRKAMMTMSVMALSFGLATATASAALMTQNVNFGTNADGDGGFTLTNTVSSDLTWSTEANALRLTVNDNDSNNNAFAVSQNASLANNDFTVIGDLVFTSTGAGTSNNMGLFLFAGSAPDSEPLSSTGEVGLSFAFRPNDDKQLLIENGGGTAPGDTQGTTVATAVGTSYTYTVTGTYQGNGDLDLQFDLSDGTNTDTLTHTVDAADIPTGDHHGFAARVGAQGENIIDFTSYQVVPEPASLAMGLVGFGALALRRKRSA